MPLEKNWFDLSILSVFLDFFIMCTELQDVIYWVILSKKCYINIWCIINHYTVITLMSNYTTIPQNGKICVLAFCSHKNKVMSDNTMKHGDPLILKLLYKSVEQHNKSTGSNDTLPTACMSKENCVSDNTTKDRHPFLVLLPRWLFWLI